MDDGQMFHTDDTFTCDFSHDDESMFATGSDDGTVGFWNVWNFKKIGKYSIENYWKRNYDNSKNEYAIRSVEFDPNGDGLAYAVSTLELD